MSKVLTALLESRDAAQKAYDDFVNPLIEAGAGLTDEQTEKRSELRRAIIELDERIDEVDGEEKRNAQLAEVRSRALGGNHAPQAEVTEPTVYGPNSENSYFLDLVHAANPLDNQFTEARERLLRASHEAAVEMVSNKDPEVRHKIRRLLVEEKRSDKDTVKEALKRYEALGRTGRGELRTGMDTTSGSGGSFVTPVYFVQKYAPYREAGRAFADQLNKQDLPPYGMTVNIPAVEGPAAVVAQTEGGAVTETDPTAGYRSANLTTEAGQVKVSQQLLDRAGPGIQFDRIVFDQLQRDYAPKVDALALTTALAGAGAITYTDTTGFHLATASGVGGFISKLSGAKSAIRHGAGVFMRPTHLFLVPDRWEYIESWTDSQGRPVVVPDYAGPVNAIAGGSPDGDNGVEGATGYRLKGLRVFNDQNIPTPGTGADQAVVANLDDVYLFEGTPIPRVLPQTVAGNLQVLLQLYSYVAVVPMYPTAVQSISGSGMAAITF